MGVLESDLFSNPENRELERCAVDDRYHITPGSTGKHVRLIQIALNRLNPNLFLIIDGVYGSATARAVVLFKERQSPPLRQTWQRVADDIVGIRTVRALDKEIADQDDEEDLTWTKGLIAPDYRGFPLPDDHNHQTVCVPFLDADTFKDPDTGKLLITHKGTPINPQLGGRLICIGGANEAKYLGFENFVPDPKRDDANGQAVSGRGLLHELKCHCATDICMRSAPLDPYVVLEIRRIAKLGAHFTYCTHPRFLASTMGTLLTLGTVIASEVVVDDPDKEPDIENDQHAVTIKVMNVRGCSETPAFHRQAVYPPADFVP